MTDNMVKRRHDRRPRRASFMDAGWAPVETVEIRLCVVWESGAALTSSVSPVHMRSRSTSRFCLMLLMLSISWRTASAVLHTRTRVNNCCSSTICSIGGATGGYLLTSWSNSRLWLRCSNWAFLTRRLLFSSTWPFMWEWSPPPPSSFGWLICAATVAKLSLGLSCAQGTSFKYREFFFKFHYRVHSAWCERTAWK